MRVFELARELNMPGKDLIVRMKALGLKVDGNFNVLDEKQIKEIRSKLADVATAPVIEKPPPAEGEGEAAEAELPTPRRRRVISAKGGRSTASEEVVVEEAGKPVLRKRRGIEEEPPEVPVEEAPPEVPAGEPAPEEPGIAAEAPTAVEATETVIPPVGEQVESAKVTRTSEDELEQRRTAKGLIEAKLKDWQDEKGKWREVKRTDRKQAVSVQTDEWVRPPRRKGDRKSGRGGRVLRDGEQKHVFGPRKKAIRIGNVVTVSELAGAIGIKGSQIIRKLFELGITANINEPIDGATAELIANDYNVEIEVDTRDLEDLVKEEIMDPEKLVSRPPIVTIMGHVDHGKTSLLDYIRKSHITTGEAGGITQHIGAYYVRSAAGDVVFLDTPGHEAFTSLRARGANVTDLVILVVAADDGIMPQTVEAIDHARAAKVPIIVAANKIDRPNADLPRIKRQLMEHELLAEEFGGDTVIVPVSAHTGEGVEQLLEMVHLQAELLELKSVREGHARGYVIESQMDRQRGPVATVLVQRGTLRAGDYFVAGNTYGRVRALYDDRGKHLAEAGPSVPTEVLGTSELPGAGDVFVVMEDEKAARQIAQRRSNRRRAREAGVSSRVSLQDFLKGISADEVRQLNIVLKADTQGSLEALRGALEKQGNEQVRVAFIRAGVGGITETDVNLAGTSDAVVLGFSVRPESKAAELARSEGIEIKTYTVIYDMINDIHDALEGMLKPIQREEIIGHCEVRQVFSTTKDIKIAGGYITDGRVDRNSMVRLYRNDVLTHTGAIQTLRRFKDDVQNVQSGYECGVRIENFNDLQEGDLIEAFIVVEEVAKLERAEHS